MTAFLQFWDKLELWLVTLPFPMQVIIMLAMGVPLFLLAATVVELTDGEGAHAVYDGVGKDTFDTSLEVLRVRGTLVLFGGASGQVPPFDLQRLNAAGALYVTRPSLVHYTRTGEETRWRGGEVFGAWASGELDVRIGERFPLADAAAAHAALESRSTTGKVVLTLS